LQKTCPILWARSFERLRLAAVFAEHEILIFLYFELVNDEKHAIPAQEVFRPNGALGSGKYEENIAANRRCLEVVGISK
jgi:hypothetical protein